MTHTFEVPLAADGSPDVTHLPAHLRADHAGHWNRYTVHAPTHQVAALVAARLDWWLHAWQWKPHTHVLVTDHDPDPDTAHA